MAPLGSRPLRLGYLEAILNNLAAAITLPFVVPYAVTLGAGGGETGVIIALPLLAVNLSQIPAARWGARSSHPRRYLLLAGGLGRVAWLALALLLLANRGSLPALLAVAIAASISSGLLWPVWTAFLGEQVAADRRGSYFGTRNLLGGIAAVGGTLLAAYLVSVAGFTRGYGLALTAATLALSGALAAQILALGCRPIRGPLAAPPAAEHNPAAWRLRAVQRYAAYGVLLVLGAGMATPFYSVYFINRLHGSPEAATSLIATANAMVMLAQGLWGKVIDRYGHGVVASSSLAVIALQPLLWLVAADPMHAVPIWLINGLAWAACGLANFNLVLAISNESNRASVVAWISVFQAPADFAAPLVGGFLADRVDLPALFLISAAVRLAAWIAFLRGFQAVDPAD